MKLTKAQRLFVKAGVELGEVLYWKWANTCDSVEGEQEIAKHKKKRKKLLRQALEAARSENTEHYMNGINEVLRLIGR